MEYESTNKWTKVFINLLETLEFELVRDDDGTYYLEDLEGVNLGDIRSDRFDTASEIIDRLDHYITDFYLDDDEWGSYESPEQALKECPEHPCRELFEMMAYHQHEIDLSKAI